MFPKSCHSVRSKDRIFSLNNSGSCDKDGIKVKPVKYVMDVIAPSLTHIFNLCLANGVFPQQMQIARVAVVYKKGDKNDFANYRPLSILPVFSKGLEKVILTRMNNFCSKHNILTPSQFGFRKHRSTELALLEQKEYILKSLDDRNLALGVYVDFSKAFDHLNHKLLLKKLQVYGFRGTSLMLLSSYLGSRQQYVEINGHRSNVKALSSGVPQGSIMGPFLFNIYVNDITQIDREIKMVIYADDTSLFFSASSASNVVMKANTALRQLEKWTKYNALKINTSKTKAIIYRPKTRMFILTMISFLIILK